jgi:glycosyltransferase involved in cell wall biosynthesis
MHLVILTQVLDREDAILGFFHRWCAVFAEHLDRLTVVAQRVGPVDLPDNVSVLSLGKEQGAGRWAMLKSLQGALFGMRGERRPDAVWVHMVPKLVLYVAPACVPRGIPIDLWYTHKGVDGALRLAVPLVRRVFTASRESFRLPIQEQKLEITGHGIDCRHFTPREGHRPVDVLCLGRIAPSKGQDELLKGLAVLHTCPVTEIAGDILLERDREYRERLEALVRLNPTLAGHVRFLGAVSWREVPEVLCRARILVNASTTGSLDKVVLEAMACGTLPLTCNEAFEPLFGPALAERLMFERGNPTDLAARLKALLTLPEHEAQELRGRLREMVLADHDLERLVPRILTAMTAEA